MEPLLANSGASCLPAPRGPTWNWDADAGSSDEEHEGGWVMGGGGGQGEAPAAQHAAAVGDEEDGRLEPAGAA
jgi:hypothetical protein